MTIHAWGNGDIDTVQIVNGVNKCRVMFLGHDPPWQFTVAESVAERLLAAYEEWLKFDEVFTPWACFQHKVNRLYTPRGDYELE